MKKSWYNFLEGFFCFFFKDAKKELEAIAEEEIPDDEQVAKEATVKTLQKQDIIKWLKDVKQSGARQKCFFNTVVTEKLKKEL